ncbi:[NiFe]-hydrogenase assembly chaperone HybE [Erythrobacter sp. SCSIO 43205]|uniref:[NiFe]-hydrogenase assembly chaperone HybE n=1 Tax=Erythrobacter sp. SCSIO 43205 TaxID=2779361 RepID=UPI001CA88B3B|nr:[NiFe]-hydrogenase assembly chaperone HybE [Erythrobacter sp. SCSIO 43205]UAB77845.1 [NiFe]-hydrogenase assembly chaperone HybE [Erythrobacter sp. SCSIO 43205]
MDHLAALSQKVETVFNHIAETRMDGVPILNPALGVAMSEMQRFDAYHTGILVTPWFMNLLLFPMEAQASAMRVGQKRNIALPSGMYEAVWSHEDALGGYWSVSLFSPMFEFAEMDIAIETAKLSMEMMFTTPDEEDAPDFGEAMVQPGSGQDVEQRMAIAEAKTVPGEAERMAGDAKAAKPKELDRRALFGRGRREDEGQIA